MAEASIHVGNMESPQCETVKCAVEEAEIVDLCTFTPFPDLPTELQIKIWKYTIPRPQVVNVEFHLPGGLNRPFGCFSTEATPSALLQVCKLSREEILKEYNVCIEVPGLERKIRLDGVNDTLFLWQEDNSGITFQNDEEGMTSGTTIPCLWALPHLANLGIETLLVHHKLLDYFPLRTIVTHLGTLKKIIVGACLGPAAWNGMEIAALIPCEWPLATSNLRSTETYERMRETLVNRLTKGMFGRLSPYDGKLDIEFVEIVASKKET